MLNRCLIPRVAGCARKRSIRPILRVDGTRRHNFDACRSGTAPARDRESVAVRPVAMVIHVDVDGEPGDVVLSSGSRTADIDAADGAELLNPEVDGLSTAPNPIVVGVVRCEHDGCGNIFPEVG